MIPNTLSSMQMSRLIDRPWAIPVLIYIVGLVIQLLYFGTYMTAPNSHMVAFGGDPFVIYNDMKFHICHGEGTHLDFMNYPYGESIFMTDMQASFTLVFKWVNDHLFEICDYVPGLAHGTIMAFMPLAAVFLFLIFKRLNVSLIWSVVFALLIAYLSPQLLRLRGHLGLVYPFMIPMTMYWLLDLYERKSSSWKDLVYGFVIFFFTLNNAYTGVLMAMPLICASVFMVFSDRKQALRFLTGGVLPVLLAYVVIKVSDPFDDRVHTQWGTFYYNLKLDTILHPEGSLLHWLLNDSQVDEIDKRMNIGLGNVLTVVIMLIYGVVLLLRKKRWTIQDGYVRLLLGAGFLCLLYAVNINLLPFLKPLMEDYFKVFLMFKGVGRFAWVTYYAVSIAGVYGLYQLCKKYADNVILRTLPYIVGAVWAAEVHYVMKDVVKSNKYENHFKTQELIDDLAGIDVTPYQAIYTLPPQQGWNDKIIIKDHWAAQYSAYLLSSSTGLPVINSHLSRASIGHTASSLSISSDPLLPKPRLKSLPNSKPVLLMLADDHKPSVGEQYLIDKSVKVGRFMRSTIYSMPADISSMVPDVTSPTGFYYHDDCSKYDAPAMIGAASRYCYPGKTTLVEVNQLNPLNDKWIFLSLWTKVDKESYHTPSFFVENNGESYTMTSRESRDWYKDWRRQDYGFHYKGGPIKIIGVGEKPYLVDEIHIRSADQNTYLSQGDTLIYNGYPTK